MQSDPRLVQLLRVPGQAVRCCGALGMVVWSNWPPFVVAAGWWATRHPSPFMTKTATTTKKKTPPGLALLSEGRSSMLSWWLVPRVATTAAPSLSSC